MRRMIAITMAALVLVAGCARGSDRAPTAVAPTGVKDAGVYLQVVLRYLTTPRENSFPDTIFKTVYVFGQAEPDAGNPTPGKQPAIS